MLHKPVCGVLLHCYSVFALCSDSLVSLVGLGARLVCYKPINGLALLKAPILFLT